MEHLVRYAFSSENISSVVGRNACTKLKILDSIANLMNSLSRRLVQ
jgi:hypothetical protein